jgi:hypothetical protein
VNKVPFRLRPGPFKGLMFLRQLKRYAASEATPAWLGVIFTLALAWFTWALVHVASKQTKILSSTDKALHLAASAQKASAETAEKLRQFTEATNRAWIGPTSARSDPFEAGKPIKITVSYSNTGRLLASFTVHNGGDFFTKEAWNDGRVSTAISPLEKDCMNGATTDKQPPNSRDGLPNDWVFSIHADV